MFGYTVVPLPRLYTGKDWKRSECIQDGNRNSEEFRSKMMMWTIEDLRSFKMFQDLPHWCTYSYSTHFNASYGQNTVWYIYINMIWYWEGMGKADNVKHPKFKTLQGPKEKRAKGERFWLPTNCGSLPQTISFGRTCYDPDAWPRWQGLGPIQTPAGLDFHRQDLCHMVNNIQ